MRKNSIPNFIQKTWEIVQDPQYCHILDWSQDGTSFIILNEVLLCSQVLPKYFKHSNFSSFIRQLNMYNFHKMKKAQGSIEFCHRLFRKDKKQLLIGIKRKPSEAEIEYGEELIRKMSLDFSISLSRQNSISDENTPVNSQYQQNIKQRRDTIQLCQKNKVFESAPTFYYPMWMGFGMPLFQANGEHYQNGSGDTHGRKILANIIIKTPPNEWNK